MAKTKPKNKISMTKTKTIFIVPDIRFLMFMSNYTCLTPSHRPQGDRPVGETFQNI